MNSGEIKEAYIWVSISWRDAITYGDGKYGTVQLGLTELLMAMEPWQRDSLGLLLTPEGSLRKAGTAETTPLHLIGEQARFHSKFIGRALGAYLHEEAPKVLEVLRAIINNPEEYAKRDQTAWQILGWGHWEKMNKVEPPGLLKTAQAALDAVKAAQK